jgi:cytoskeletal protein RodZ
VVFVKSYTAIPNIGGALSLGFGFNYYRSKDIGFSITNAMSMGMTMVYSIKSTGYAITGGIGMGLTFSFTIADTKVATPSITNKTIEDAKQLSNSNFSYWNAQLESNRTTIEGDLPNPYDYPIDFAIRYRPDEFALYTYYRITKSGDIVKWRVVNNDEATITVYGKVGSSSYTNYGSLTSGSTSSLLSKTVTDGQTTVYVYGTATGQTTSDVASL